MSVSDFVNPCLIAKPATAIGLGGRIHAGGRDRDTVAHVSPRPIATTVLSARSWLVAKQGANDGHQREGKKFDRVFLQSFIENANEGNVVLGFQEERVAILSAIERVINAPTSSDRFAEGTFHWCENSEVENSD